MQNKLEQINGVISERNLVLTLFEFVGYEYKKEGETERYPLYPEGEKIINLIVKAERAEEILDRLKERGFVGGIIEQGQDEN